MKWLRLSRPAVVAGVLATAGLASVAPAASADTVATPTNANCTIVLPSAPLIDPGLATPYTLSGTVQSGPCSEANAGETAFVQGAVLSPNGQISVYNPLLISVTAP